MESQDKLVAVYMPGMEAGHREYGVFNYGFITHLSACTTPVQSVVGTLREALGTSLQEERVLRYRTASLESE